MLTRCFHFISVVIIVILLIPWVEPESSSNFLHHSRTGFVNSIQLRLKLTHGLSKIFREHLTLLDFTAKRRRTKIHLSIQAPEKPQTSGDQIDKTNFVGEWIPWNEVALAADIRSNFQTVIHTSTHSEINESKASADFEASRLDSVPKRLEPKDTRLLEDEPWRSELFYKTNLCIVKTSDFPLVSDSVEPAMSLLSLSAVAQDGFSAAEWLVQRRRTVAANSAERNVKNKADPSKWSEYNQEEVAALYGRRPLAVAMRLVEASVAFATWLDSRSVLSNLRSKCTRLDGIDALPSFPCYTVPCMFDPSRMTRPS
jgi:hypothetical protein